MAKDAKITHFGNFFRWRIADRGKLTDAGDALGLSLASLRRYSLAATRDELHILPATQIAIARFFGFESVEALDKAWRTTPLPPFPKRENRALAAMTVADVMKWLDSAALDDVREVLEHGSARLGVAGTIGKGVTASSRKVTQRGQLKGRQAASPKRPDSGGERKA